jgi:hypothetical protein
LGGYDRREHNADSGTKELGPAEMEAFENISEFVAGQARK